MSKTTISGFLGEKKVTVILQPMPLGRPVKALMALAIDGDGFILKAPNPKKDSDFDPLVVLVPPRIARGLGGFISVDTLEDYPPLPKTLMRALEEFKLIDTKPFHDGWGKGKWSDKFDETMDDLHEAACALGFDPKKDKEIKARMVSTAIEKANEKYPDHKIADVTEYKKVYGYAP